MNRHWIGVIGFVALAALVVGCGPAVKPEPAKPAVNTSGGNGHSHDGWWCDEHGMPEEVCAQCNSKVAADFQKKGDWCEKHNRPDTQCFICHPELVEKFAAQYEAKYGKQPPKPDPN